MTRKIQYFTARVKRDLRLHKMLVSLHSFHMFFSCIMLFLTTVFTFSSFSPFSLSGTTTQVNLDSCTSFCPQQFFYSYCFLLSPVPLLHLPASISWSSYSSGFELLPHGYYFGVSRWFDLINVP